MELINRYFGSMLFVKTEEKEGYIIYAAKIVSSYSDGSGTYVLAFVPTHLAIKTRAYLYELPWHNIQTRLIKSYRRLPDQRWNPERNLPTIVFSLTERGDRFSRYRTEDGSPFELLLLHDPKKPTKYQYHDRINLITALNTFRSVINYTGSESPLLLTSVPVPADIEYVPPPT